MSVWPTTLCCCYLKCRPSKNTNFPGTDIFHATNRRKQKNKSVQWFLEQPALFTLTPEHTRPSLWPLMCKVKSFVPLSTRSALRMSQMKVRDIRPYAYLCLPTLFSEPKLTLREIQESLQQSRFCQPRISSFCSLPLTPSFASCGYKLLCIRGLICIHRNNWWRSKRLTTIIVPYPYFNVVTIITSNLMA
jgi:hypothetical protein